MNWDSYSTVNYNLVASSRGELALAFPTCKSNLSSRSSCFKEFQSQFHFGVFGWLGIRELAS